MKLKLFIITVISFVFLISCSENIEQKAQGIHKRVLTIDTHCDTPLRLIRGNHNIGIKNDPHKNGGKVDFIRMKEGGQDAMFFAVFLGQGPLTDDGFKKAKNLALKLFDAIHKSIKANPELAELAFSSRDAKRIEESGKRAIYIGIENGYPIGKDISLIKKFYDLGARYITLSHSLNNQICDSSTDKKGRLHGGLSDFGKEVVKEMNKLGMIIDVSHISDESFYQVLELSKTPVMASHSSARAICNNPRNLNDKMIRTIAKSGGIIQVCFYSAYVKTPKPNIKRDNAFKKLQTKYKDFQMLPKGVQNKARKEYYAIYKKYPSDLATVSDLVNHIDHIVKLTGYNHVGIGTDFDGGGGLKDCFDVSQMGNVTLELVKRGYTEEQIKKIWGGNFIRIFKEVEKVAKI